MDGGGVGIVIGSPRERVLVNLRRRIDSIGDSRYPCLARFLLPDGDTRLDLHANLDPHASRELRSRATLLSVARDVLHDSGIDTGVAGPYTNYLRFMHIGGIIQLSIGMQAFGLSRDSMHFEMKLAEKPSDRQANRIGQMTGHLLFLSPDTVLDCIVLTPASSPYTVTFRNGSNSNSNNGPRHIDTGNLDLFFQSIRTVVEKEWQPG